MRTIVSNEKLQELAPVLLVLFVFFIPISVSIKSIFLFLTVIALVMTPCYRSHLHSAFNTLWARVALILFIYIALASLWSEAPISLRYMTTDKYSKLLLLPIFAVGFIQARTRQWVLNSYISAMLLTCILSLLKAKNLVTLNSIDPGEVFYNHIVTGIMIALAVYFAGILLLRIKTPGLRFFYFVMVVLGSYQILFINTGRSGYIAYAILMPLFFLLMLPAKKVVWGMVLFIAMVSSAYIISPVMQKGIQRMLHEVELLQANQVGNSLGARIQFHRYAYTLFKEHPIKGIGTGGFQSRYIKDQPVPSWGPKLKEPHSQYWLILSEQGVIGILLMLFFLSSLLITALQLKEMKPFFLGMLGCFCVFSFSDTIFCYSSLGYLLILFSALSFGELLEAKSLKK